MSGSCGPFQQTKLFKIKISNHSVVPIEKTFKMLCKNAANAILGMQILNIFSTAMLTDTLCKFQIIIMIHNYHVGMATLLFLSVSHRPANYSTLNV